MACDPCGVKPFSDPMLVCNKLGPWEQISCKKTNPTNLLLSKMAAISQTTFSNAVFLMKMLEFQFQFSLEFVPKGPVDNNSALVQIMACRLFGAKPLPEPMLSQFTDAYTALGGDELIISSAKC